MKIIFIFSFVVFCVSCAHQDQYVYENVGTTSPMLVQKQSHQKTLKQQAKKESLVEKVEGNVSKSPVVKKQPKITFVADNMGTQDTDWVPIGTLVDDVKVPVKENPKICPVTGSGCATDGSCCKPKKQRPKMKYYPSRYQRHKRNWN